MKRLPKRNLSKLLTQYVDGELSVDQERELMEYVRADEEAAKDLAELRAVKGIVAKQEPLPPDRGFWTRLSTELDRREGQQENLLPFPRRLVPVFAGLGVVAIAVIGFLVFQNRIPLTDYFSEQSQRVQKAYEENVLRGSLLPVFDRIDKNQVLQFALFGTLPMDASAQSTLRVDESAEKGYRIDVGKPTSGSEPPVTVSELVREVDPSATQLQVIDSLLDFGRKKIETSVFVGSDQVVAIDPNLPRLNRAILSSIAACLEPPQRVRFERFLQARNAPYMLASFEGQPEKPERIYDVFKRSHHPDRFLVMTPDTLVLAEVELNLDSLREAAFRLAGERSGIQLQVNAVLQGFAQRRLTHSWRFVQQNSGFDIQADSDVISIRVPSRVGFDHTEFKEVVVRPRFPRIPSTLSPKGGPSFNIRYSHGDSGTLFEMQIDSLMMRFFRNVPRGMTGFEDVDSIIEMGELRFGLPSDEEMHDQWRQVLRQHKVDFDTLREQIRKWMVVPSEKERVPKKRTAIKK